MTDKAKIKEIFSSVQGEGLYIGTKQLFIRFCSCNLNCKYCDTDFLPNNINDGSFFDFTQEELVNYISSNFKLDDIRFISLTGGEPLIWNKFLSGFLPKIKIPFYLETNATITENLDIILPYINVISADIKLPSSSGIENSFEMHDAFFKAVNDFKIDCAIRHQFDCERRKIFAKIVFDDLIRDSEIKECVELAKKYDLELILQPKMSSDGINLSTYNLLEIFDKFACIHKNTRLIPQVHKFLGIE